MPDVATVSDLASGHSIEVFAANLAKSFYGFESDFFQQNVSRIVDDVLSQIYASIELWPRLVEICYYHKDRWQFPQIRVRNRRARRLRTTKTASASDATSQAARSRFSVVPKTAA